MAAVSPLLDCPVEIQGEIFRFTDPVTRFLLRHVCRAFLARYPFPSPGNTSTSTSSSSSNEAESEEMFFFSGFLVEAAKLGYLDLLVRLQCSFLPLPRFLLVLPPIFNNTILKFVYLPN